jgi:hypothetical protein
MTKKKWEKGGGFYDFISFRKKKKIIFIQSSLLFSLTIYPLFIPKKIYITCYANKKYKAVIKFLYSVAMYSYAVRGRFN